MRKKYLRGRQSFIISVFAIFKKNSIKKAYYNVARKKSKKSKIKKYLKEKCVKDGLQTKWFFGLETQQ